MLYRCEQCNGDFGIDGDATGVETVGCPHCAFETRLYPQRDATESLPEPTNEIPPSKPTFAYMMEGTGLSWLEVYEDRVEIKSDGLFSGTSTNAISFRSITAINLKRAGLAYGYLHFSIPGGSDPQSSAFLTLDGDVGVAESMGSNSFKFTNGFFGKDKNDELASQIKSFIEDKIRELHRPASPQLASSSLSDELTKLAALKTQGLLTEAEFQAAKQRLISGQ